MKYIVYLIVGICTLWAVEAKALPPSGKIDKNNDGLVTWEEFSSAFPGVTKEHFDEIDTDKNGTLDTNEMAVFRNRFGGSRPNGARGGSSMGSGNSGGTSSGGMALPVLPSKK